VIYHAVDFSLSADAMYPPAHFPLPAQGLSTSSMHNHVLKGAAAMLSQAVSMDQAGELRTALQLYAEALEIFTGLMNELEADGEGSIAGLEHEDRAVLTQIRLALPPYYERAAQIAATPAYQVAKKTTQTRMTRPLFHEHEGEVQAAASQNGEYPVVAGQPYSRANWLVLAEAHERDKALLAEHKLTQAFVDRCHLSPGPLGPTPGDPWEGRAAIPERERNMVGHRQNTVAKARQEVEQIWLSAMANAQQKC